MGCRRTWHSGIVVLLSTVALLGQTQAGKIEILPRLQEGAVSEEVRATLQDAGYRIRLEDGSVSGEWWLRSPVPVQPEKSAEGVVYTQLAESTLLGVLHLPAPSNDYRGQATAAGYYTLRYALMPADGNHLGAAPDRDFLLLIPATADRDPKAEYKFSELVALSRQASGTKHPAPLSLVEPLNERSATLSKDEDRVIFSITVKTTKGTDLPLSLVVKGTAAQ